VLLESGPMLRWLVVAACVLSLGWAGAAAATSPPAPPDTVPTSDNEFLPDEDLSDCVSALPPPSCGSEARGGWRQAIVLVLIGLALVFIVWRIVRNARRRWE
jgi:hypothetical protein